MCQTILCIVLLSLAATADARVWRAATDGSGHTLTIQAAIDSAASGDTVSIANGTWTEPLKVRRKILTLRGDSQNGTVLDGFLDHRVLKIEQCVRVTVENLTVTAGLRNHTQYPETAGAGIAAFHSALTLRGITVRDNIGSLGLGAGVYSSVRELPGDLPPPGFQPGSPGLLVEDCLFQDNNAGDNGGHLFVEETDAILRNSTFQRGRAVDGGAVSVLNGTLVVEGCTFSQNTARLDGGAILVSGLGSWSVSSTAFLGNRADRRGGGLASQIAGVGSLASCGFLDNSASEGGGLYARNVPVSAIQVFWRDNGASTRGGGVLLEDVTSANFQRCTWAENTSANGASVFVLRSAASMTRCLFGDASPTAVGCELGSANASCSQAVDGMGGCLAVADRGPVSLCDSDPFGLCFIPATETCGTLGHVDAPCNEPGCQTPVRPLSWGMIKARAH